MGEWKPDLYGMGWAITWSARNRSTATSTDRREPQITDW